MICVFVLGLEDVVKKVVCKACANRGEITSNCYECGGRGIHKKTVKRFKVKNRYIEIEKIDRDPKTGIIRYWTGACDFYYETTYPALNSFMPDVPFGIHMVHNTLESAQVEVDRINTFLAKQERSK
jgi:hypothetical protein